MQRILLLVALCYLIGFLAHTALIGKAVYGDGIFYFSWVRSVVVDGDVGFANEYAEFGVTQPPTAYGTPGNKYAIGAPLLWLPQYLAVHRLIRSDGYGLPYQLAAGFTSVAGVITALLLLFRYLERTYDRNVGLLTTLTIAGGTNLLFYGSLDPVNSHAATFLWATVALLLTAGQAPAMTTGIAYGFLALSRLQEAPSLLVAGLSYPRRTWPLLTAGFLMGIMLQVLAWVAVSGSPVNPYLAGGETFRWLSPNIAGVLFSLENGVILWTPVVLLGFIGLAVRVWQRREPLWIGMVAAVLVQLYLVASWSTWWQGASYSARMLVGVLPFIAVGLAECISGLRRMFSSPLIVFLCLTLPLCSLNLLSIVYFLLRH